MSRLLRPRAWLQVAMGALVLSACGGRSSDSTDAVPVLQTQMVSVTPASTVPAGAVALVAEVSTSTDSGSLSTSLRAPADGRLDSDLTLALDATGEIVLASVRLAHSGRVELDARTTGVALVRLAQGPIASSGLAMNSAIEAAPGFADLEAAIQNALGRGATPATDTTVLLAVVAVLNDTSVSAIASTREERVRPLALPGERIEDTPFTLLNGGIGFGSVEITSSGTFVAGNNSTLMHWSVSANGETEVVEPKKTFTLSSSYAPFPLTLEQTVETRRLNANETVRVVATALLGWLPSTVAPGAACGKTVGKLLLRSEALDHALGQTEPTEWLAYFADLKNKVNALDIAKLYLDCYGAAAPASYAGTAARFVASMSFLSSINRLKAIIQTATAARTFLQLVAYWGVSKPYGVCQEEHGLIRSCAASFTVAKDLVLIPGAATTPTYEALDATGASTGLAKSLRFESTNESSLLVYPADGRIVGFNPGSGAIRVVEPITEVSSDIAVRVVTPNIEPQVVRVSKNDGVILRFVDPQGGSLVTDGAPVTWTVDRPDRVRFDLQGPGAAVLKALAEGIATVTANFDVTGETRTAQIQVSGTIFEGPVLISGPATTASTCMGTITVDGTVTVESAMPSTLKIVGTETIDQSCYHQTSPVSLTIQLTGAGGHYEGSGTFPFTCAPPCISGQVSLSADLGITTVIGGSPFLQGTVTYSDTNQSPFQGNASGTISIPLRPPSQ